MKVLVSDTLQEEGIKVLQESGLEVIKNYKITPAELEQEIENYDAIIIRSRTKLTASVLANAKSLKAIGRAGVGLDNVDLKKAEEMNIKVFNTPEAPSVSVAELTLGLLISLMRKISKADKSMHEGQWLKSNYLGNTLKGKKAGIVGFGNIGQEVAKRMAAFEMEIGIYDIIPELLEEGKKLGYSIYSSIDELVQDAQVISLHIPAVPSTENTINESRLNLMNEKTLIINTARGKLINEGALVNALKNKKIGGAALDVYREEPTKNEELFGCEENLILTPHIGSNTKETQVDASVLVAKKISDYLKSL